MLIETAKYSVKDILDDIKADQIYYQKLRNMLRDKCPAHVLKLFDNESLRQSPRDGKHFFNKKYTVKAVAHLIKPNAG